MSQTPQESITSEDEIDIEEVMAEFSTAVANNFEEFLAWLKKMAEAATN